MNGATVVLGAVIFVAGSGGGGYALGEAEAPTERERADRLAEARETAGGRAEGEASALGRLRGRRAGLASGRERGRNRALRVGRAAGEEEVARLQEAAAAAAVAAEPTGPPAPTGTSCPPPYSYSMGTCTLYNVNSCGPGQIRVHATLECIPGAVPVAPPAPEGAVCEGIPESDEYLACLRANGE